MAPDPCPVCGCTKTYPDSVRTDDGEMRVDVCARCDFPPSTPVSVEEWREKTWKATYRPDLPPVTDRIYRLPVRRGYPVPWFVAWLDDAGAPVERGTGTPDFRVLAPDALERAYRESLCWVCGEPRGRYAAFVSGPMCGVSRTASEPPCHPECAGWAACACPFLVRPHARRREAGLPEGTVDPAGVPIRRNPGVALVWASRDWRRWTPPGGGILYHMGTPEQVQWFAEGRLATHDEVRRSVISGLPALMELAVKGGDEEIVALDEHVRYVLDELAPKD